MSYDQTFKGKFVFADARCLEAGLDRFAVALDDSIVDLDSLEIRGLEVRINIDCSAPASMYDSTMHALHQLGEHAKSGGIKATFTLDGTSREQVYNGGRRTGAGLPDPHHRWDLYFAAKQGDVARLRELEQAGVALDQTFDARRGWSALHLAAHTAEAEAGDAVTLLLAAGVDPNLCSGAGTTPLAVASTAEIVGLLVAGGADPDRAVGDSNALAIALSWGRFEVGQALLEAGARVPESQAKDVIETCARRGQVGLLSQLVKRAPELGRWLAAPEVMEAAISSGESVLVDLLLEHGATLPESLLVDAVRSGSLALVETALRLPGALERCGRSSDYDDAMCIVANAGNLPVMQLLARHGVPLEPAEPGPTSPLHSAVQAWDGQGCECARWLLDAGVAIDGLDAQGNTPLAAAADFNRPAGVILLLERGADPGPIARLDRGERARLRKAMGAQWAALVPKKTSKKKTGNKTGKKTSPSSPE